MLGGTEQTVATQNDREMVDASLSAAWADEAFARVTGGSFEFKWEGRNSDEYPSRPRDGSTHISEMATSLPDDGRSPTFSWDHNDENGVVNVHSFDQPDEYLGFPWRDDPESNDVWVASSQDEFWWGENPGIEAEYCLSYEDDPFLTTNACSDSSTGARAEAAYTTHDMNAHIGHALDRRGRFIANGTRTEARCFDDGSTPRASADPGTLQIANAHGHRNDQFNYVRELPLPAPDDVADPDDGYGPWFRMNTNQPNLLVGTHRYVLLVRPKVNTFVRTDPPYALSEVSATIQVYADTSVLESEGVYIDSMDFVVSRSECGVAIGNGALPDRAGTYRGEGMQGPWPDPIYPGQVDRTRTGVLDPQPAAGTSRSQLMARSEPAVTDERGTDDPEATTTRSPDETTTASETTTSAPPDDNVPTTETTRPTSTLTPTPTSPPTPTTPPSTSTPTTSAESGPTTAERPEPLPATADLTECGTVADGDVTYQFVIDADECTGTAARAGASVLEDWVSDGEHASGGWQVFTSRDSTRDGWVHAAVNTRTGEVVYAIE